MSEQTQRALELARQKLVEMQETLNTIFAEAMTHGVVQGLGTRRMLGSDESSNIVAVATPTGVVEVLRPKAFEKKLEVGVLVRMSTQPPAIVGIVDSFVRHGTPAVCIAPLGSNRVEVMFQGEAKIVIHNLPTLPEEGDRLLVDDTGTVVIESFGKDQSRFKVTNMVDVRWDDVGGLEDAKASLIEAIEAPVKHAKLYAQYKKKTLKGVLLYGPPGCGKTLLAKAAASSIVRVNKGVGADSAFIYVKGPELLDKWVGNTEALIRGLFARAREHKKKHGYPAIIFIDEADALLGARGSTHMSTLGQTVVPQFLSEMDGIEESGAIVLLSTNRPDTLDSAVVREGRIDRKVRISRPDKKSAKEIFKIHLRGRPLASDVDSVDTFAELCAEALFSSDLKLYEVSKKQGETLYFTLSSLVNGALIAQFVEDMAARAIQRDVDSNRSRPSGLTVSDIADVAMSLFRQNRDVDHKEALAEFVETFSKDVASVKRFVADKKANGSNGGAKAPSQEK